MQCTNCGKEVPDSAKACGHCGHRLKGAYQEPITQPIKKQQGLPGWVWSLVGSSIILLIGFILYQLGVFGPNLPVAEQPTRFVPPPTAYPTLTPYPTYTPDPTFTPVPTATKEIVISQVDRCSLFDGIIPIITWLDFENGTTLGRFYAKFPDAVPGLGKSVEGDDAPWEYRFKIGGMYATNCTVYKEYPDRLYCDYPFQGSYSNTFQVMTMFVNECENPVYKNDRAALPALPEGQLAGKGGNNNGGSLPDNGSNPPALACSSSLSSDACSTTGGTYHYTFCTIPPCPEFCICP